MMMIVFLQPPYHVDHLYQDHFVSNDVDDYDDYDDYDDNDNDHIYQPVEADVYDQPCKNPKAHDEVHLPGK